MDNALTSSLAACLRFAAALVPASATPSLVCNKTVLGAIVVEAHRLAQRIPAIFPTDAPSVPRRLLASLAQVDEHLTGVSFGDITWDFQGVVTQTLEMELEDVEERAVARNVCVLLTVSSPDDRSVETAVVWFPHANAGNNNSKKYLLYVEPGRVKLVKSVGELMSRLHDEMAAVRRPGATYKVWTLMMRKAKDAPAAKRSEPEEDEQLPVVMGPVVITQPVESVLPAQHEKRRISITVAERKPRGASIFAFPDAALESPVSSRVADDTVLSASPVEQRQHHKPPGVSTSLALRRSPLESKNSTTVWQSTDGKIKRVTISSTIAPTDPVPSEFIDDAAPTATGDSQPTHEQKAMVLLRVRPVEPLRTAAETMFQFSSTTRVESPVDDHRNPQRTPVPIREGERGGEATTVVSRSEVATSTKGLAVSSSDLDGTTSSRHSESLQAAGQEEPQAKPKKRSMRDHYRTKLGARGWWELEYQATKLLAQASAGSPPLKEPMRRTPQPVHTKEREFPPPIPIPEPLVPSNRRLQLRLRPQIERKEAMSFSHTEKSSVAVIEQPRESPEERLETRITETREVLTEESEGNRQNHVHALPVVSAAAPVQPVVAPLFDTVKKTASTSREIQGLVACPHREPASSQPVPSRFIARRQASDSESDQDSEEDDCVLTATMPTVERNQPPQRDTKDASIPAKTAAMLPFSRTERVPIRLPKSDAQRAVISAATASDNDGEPQSTQQSHHSPVFVPSKQQEQRAAQRAAAPTTAFVAIDITGSSSSQDDDATKRMREAKLSELRQRKLQALQKARDESLLRKKPTETATTRTAATKATNRQLIQNAIDFTLLAGGSLEKERQAALAALAASPCDTFVVLLKSAKELKFRALYEHHVDRGRILRIFSTVSSAPPVLTDDVVGQFFRYNSGKKEFSAIDSRTFTVKTDACALADHVMFKKKPLARLL